MLTTAGASPARDRLAAAIAALAAIQRVAEAANTRREVAGLSPALRLAEARRQLAPVTAGDFATRGQQTLWREIERAVAALSAGDAVASHQLAGLRALLVELHGLLGR
jgi:hypothetical protein